MEEEENEEEVSMYSYRMRTRWEQRGRTHF